MESLYFVAVVPPLDIRDQITSFKQYCAQHYGSRHALKSPPHITLHMPFKWKDKRLDELRKCLDLAATGSPKFEVILQDFDFFPPRVVFVDVCESPQLRELEKRVVRQMRSLHIFNATHKDRGFHPHVTIAFRDLKRALFPEARAYFSQQNYQACFEVDHIVLLRHDEGKWEQFNRFYFD